MDERKGLSTYKDGVEIPDSTPLSLPVDFRRPPPIGERIRRLVKDTLLARELAAQGEETFEDADDFDIPDDPVDPTTPYEENFDPLHTTAREMEVRAGAVINNAEKLKWARSIIAQEEGRRRNAGRSGRREANDIRELEKGGRSNLRDVRGEDDDSPRKGRKVSRVRRGDEGDGDLGEEE